MKTLLKVAAVNATVIVVLPAIIILLVQLSPWLILLAWMTVFSVCLSVMGIVAGGVRGEA
jgi:hypothetical protein